MRSDRLLDRLFVATNPGEIQPVPLMCRRVIGVESYRVLKLPFCPSPVPLVLQLRESERGVRFGERILDSKCLQGSLFGLCKCFAWSQAADIINAQLDIRVCHPNVRQRITGIFLSGLLKKGHCLSERFFGPL